MEDDVFQFLVDDLFLRIGEVGAGLVQRGGFDYQSQRCRCNRIGCKLDLSAEVARGEMMTMSFEPEQSTPVCVGHEFTLAGVEIVGYRGWCRVNEEAGKYC